MKQSSSAPRRPLPRVLDPDRLPVYYIDALLLTLVIECLARHSVVKGFSFVVFHPVGFLVSFSIILLTLHLALFIPKRLPVFTLISFIWLGFGITEFILMFNRVTPLSAVDLTIFPSVITIITQYLKVWQIIGLGILIAAAVAAVVLMFVKTHTSKIGWRSLGISLCASVVSLTLLVVAGFRTGTLSDSFPNLTDAYNDYGFAYCFTMSVIDKGVDKPEEYGEEIITGILNELDSDENPGAHESGTEPGAVPSDDGPEHKPNVIIVQLESFFDVRRIEGLSLSGEVTPHFDALCETNLSGPFIVPVIGAGTVNTEFEVLSGMRINDFGAGEYPYKSVLRDTTCETVAYDLLASGYRTHAIHNHEATFYSRNEIYRHLGFESFTAIEYFLHPEYNVNGWARDAILTDEILWLLDSTEEPDLVFTVSVQGHGKYPTDYVPAEGDIVVTGGVDDPASVSKLNYYVNQVHEMDEFVQDLTDAVMALDEDTILVFYGDHQPSLSQDEDIELTVSGFETEYLILANFELEETEADRGPLHSYQIFPLVMELIGNDTGVINRFHRIFRDSEDYLEKLATLEYDVLYGECYAYDGIRYPVMEDMTLGARPISVTGCTDDGETLTVTGENFTPFSRIVIDGSEKETVYVDEHTLTTKKGLFSGFWRSVSVRQVDGKGTTLSECPPYDLPEQTENE